MSSKKDTRFIPYLQGYLDLALPAHVILTTIFLGENDEPQKPVIVDRQAKGS